MKMEFLIIYHSQELPNKMKLLREKIEPCKKWLEIFYLNQMLKKKLGPKPLTLHVMF